MFAFRLRWLLLVAALAWIDTIQAQETPSFTGSWILNAPRSDEFQVKAEELTTAINERLRKRKAKRFEDYNRERKQGQFSSQQAATMRMMHEDARSLSWELDDDLSAMLEGKSIRIYQSNLCAVLYDKKFKRLVSINPKGRSVSRTRNAVANDKVGRSVAFFEDAGLVIDTDLLGGDRLIERFVLNEDGAQMTLDVEYRRRDLGRSLTFTRYFIRE
jgi:hypothetical protein